MNMYSSVFLFFLVAVIAGGKSESTTVNIPVTGSPTTARNPAPVTVNIVKALNDTITNQNPTVDIATPAISNDTTTQKIVIINETATARDSINVNVTLMAETDFHYKEEIRAAESQVIAESRVVTEKSVLSMVYRQPGEATPHVFSRLVPEREIIWPERMHHPEDSLMCFQEGQMHHLWSSAGDLDCLVCVCLNIEGDLHPKCATCALCSPAHSKNPSLSKSKREVEEADVPITTEADVPITTEADATTQAAMNETKT